MLKGTQIEDRDSGQRTTALVNALWRAAWMWRWFVQPAIVLFRGARLQAQCKGATAAMRGGPHGPYLGSHTDQELT